MRFVVGDNIPLAEEAFGPLGDVEVVRGRPLGREDARAADVLVVRSETRVNAALLDGSPVRFVGTATAGTDHVDLGYLGSKGVAFASAPGCNSVSVKEYVVALLLQFASKTGVSLEGLTLGVVGVGHVGSKVALAARALGMTTLLNDPPRASREGCDGFAPLDDVLAAADVVTLHVPLTVSGPHATTGLIGGRALSMMKGSAMLVNTARGGVVCEADLKSALSGGRIAAAALDVWDGEPSVDEGLFRLVFIGTPHIAGHSFEGKVNGTAMVREAVCRHFGLGLPWDPWAELAGCDIPCAAVPQGAKTVEEAVGAVVERCYDIRRDHALLEGLMSAPEGERPGLFNRLRAQYRPRREFACARVRLDGCLTGVEEALKSLGFKNFDTFDTAGLPG